MQRYWDFQPSSFDSAQNYMGDPLHDRKDWWVGLSRNRDSCALEESNFEAALKMLGGEGEMVEVHRFGHWACGWYEIILVSNTPKETAILENIALQMEDYPVLDEEDYCQREYDLAREAWTEMSIKERMELCAQNDISYFAARKDNPFDADESGTITDCLLLP